MKKEFNNIIELATKPYMRILPGNLAFSFMMALVPIISLIMFICTKLNLSPSILENITKVIPNSILETLSMLSSTTTLSGAILIIGLWAASSGMDALIIATNVIYKNEDANYIKRKIKSLILTFLVILMIIINLGILVFGDALLKFIFNILNVNTNILLFSLLKWPIALIVIFFIVKIIYASVPNVMIDSKYVNKGAAFTTIFWIVSSALYSFYINHTNMYVIKYGSFSNVIILLLWLYILSFILVLGTAINVNEYNKITK